MKTAMTEQIVRARNNNSRFGSLIRNSMLPAQQRAITGGNPFAKKVQPNSGVNVQAEVPNGDPIAQRNLAPGLSIERDVTITIDTVALGLTATLVDVVLWDESGMYNALFPYTNPAGSPSMRGSNGFYKAWLGQFCGSTVYFSNMLMQVSPAAGAAATAAQQFSQDITRYDVNSRTDQSEIIPISNYVEPGWFNQNVRQINLLDNVSRFDRSVAWKFKVYHGMVITFTFDVETRVSGL